MYLRPNFICFCDKYESDGQNWWEQKRKKDSSFIQPVNATNSIKAIQLDFFMSSPGLSMLNEKQPIYASSTSPGYSLVPRAVIEDDIKNQGVKEANKGRVSVESAKKISNAFQWLRAISNVKKVYSKAIKRSYTFRLAFITLTLPSKQVHSDKYLKEHLLEPFLKQIKRKFNAHSYIWKAEPQKNGNIHFHLTVNVFIHYNAIRQIWNTLLMHHSYIQKENFNPFNKAFPTTEIKAVRSENKIAFYIVDYMLKKQKDRRAIEGQIWNCSKNLKSGACKISGYNPLTNDEFNVVKNKMTTKIVDGYYCKIHLLKDNAYSLAPKIILHQYLNHLSVIALKETSKSFYTID